ncbi:MAG: hypothetical protein PUD59_04395 [bacterium]|nr:hypothetical protein [bacterium]
MKKNIYNLFIILLLLSILVFIITYSDEVIACVLNAINIWKNNIVTSLFPFFIISDLLINYGFVDLISELTKNYTRILFNLPGESSFVIITSMLTGFPSSAKFINELLDSKKLTIEQANYLLTFTHYPNPLFVLGVVSSLLNNKKVSIVIYISIIIGNFIIGMFLKKKKKHIKEKINIRNVLNIITVKRKKNSFITILTSSIYKSFNTLIILLGIITTFMIITIIVTNIMNLNIFSKSIISGLLEMTQGIKNISLINIPIQYKASLITFFISFGGISIHMQVMSILNDKDIKYLYYLMSRLIHAFLSSCITLLLLNRFVLIS